MERLIKNRLYSWLENSHAFPNSQFGFRNNRSCIDNLAILTSSIHSNWYAGKDTCAIFLDIQGAFDNVLGEVLINKLAKLGVPNVFNMFIYNLISAREVHYKFNTIDQIRIVHKGLPQGYVLSTLLYSIYVADLEVFVYQQRGIRLLQFADDVCLFTSSIRTGCAINNLEICINSTVDWFNNVGLTIAPHKSQFCVFKRNVRRNNYQDHIDVQGTRVMSSPVVSFLGITLQDNLKWNSHISIIYERCLKALNIIKFLRTTWWGASPPLLLNIYKGLVRSKIDYGSFIWNNLPQYLWNQIESIQNQGIRVALGYRKSTPINVLLAEACTPRIIERSYFLGMNFITNVISNPNHPLIPVLRKIQEFVDNPLYVEKFSPLKLLDNFARCDRVSHLIFSSDTPVSCCYPPELVLFQPAISFREGLMLKHNNNPARLFDTLFPRRKDQYCLFTDGSRDTSLPFSGFAVVGDQNDTCLKFRSSKLTSIFSCEVMAIISALKLARDSHEGEIVIFSDSKSVLEALIGSKNPSPKSYLIWEIRRLMVELSNSGKAVSLFWIPAQVGIVGNERADWAAKEAVLTGNDTDLLLPCNDLKAYWKANLFQEFYAWVRLRGEQKGTFYVKNFLAEKRQPWFHKSGFPRKGIISYNRLRSGHTSLLECLWRHGIVDSPLCDCGNAPQSVNHIFWQCPLLEAERNLFLHRIQDLVPYGPYNIEQFLMCKSPNITSAIIDFILSIPFNI